MTTIKTKSELSNLHKKVWIYWISASVNSTKWQFHNARSCFRLIHRSDSIQGTDYIAAEI